MASNDAIVGAIDLLQQQVAAAQFAVGSTSENFKGIPNKRYTGIAGKGFAARIGFITYPHILRFDKGTGVAVCQINHVDAALLSEWQQPEGVVKIPYQNSHPRRSCKEFASLGICL